MRVIAGKARRLNLKTIPGTDTRPTTDRIKETLFNILQPELLECRFLDLFAGSGGIGIEALSRGASYAVFVEKNPKAAACIRENLAFTKLAEDGIIIVVLTLESGSGQVLAGPDIVSRGFVYVRNSESLMDEANAVLQATMERIMDKNITDWGKIKTEIKDDLGDFVWKETKRRPMIMPIIMEV